MRANVLCSRLVAVSLYRDRCSRSTSDLTGERKGYSKHRTQSSGDGQPKPDALDSLLSRGLGAEERFSEMRNIFRGDPFPTVMNGDSGKIRIHTKLYRDRSSRLAEFESIFDQNSEQFLQQRWVAGNEELFRILNLAFQVSESFVIGER